ncbi:MAG: NYN domain-containing protein [Desulfobacteraceae bacterium]|nr:MAG: NYN domain-containing protein [Desulfobacteraceae bacterium]
MPIEPGIKRTVVFVDGQNLFYALKKAFGYPYPNYDIACLSSTICKNRNWQLDQTRFYTGIPSADDKPFWNHFWSAKLAMMGGRQGIYVFSRPLRYRNQTIALADGTTRTILVGQEKGVDVRIALDIVRLAREKQYDVALIFSQDQDLSEAAEEVRLIAAQQDRWIKLASAFPVSPAITDNRGINKTDWIKIDRKIYDTCIDPRDYRLKEQAEPL